MPTFFEGLRRMFAGKPIFDPNDDARDPQNPREGEVPVLNEPQVQSRIRKGDAHSFPVAYVTRTTCHVNGTHLDVYCHIRNNWPEQLFLDKIRLMDTTRELDTFLRPNEEREFLVYRGPQLTRQPSGQALLDYKTTHEGDYFQALHDVTYSLRPDKTFTIAAIRLHPPIRDIFG